MIPPCLVTMRLTRQLDPMFIPYMSGKIILSFNTLIPYPLAPWNWTIDAHVEVLHFTMAVQCLLRLEGGSPSAVRLTAEVALPLRMF